MFMKTAFLSTLLGSSLLAQFDPHQLMPIPEIDLITYTSEEMALMEKLKPTLFGGRPIKAGEIPVSVWISNCTATVVGKNSLLTAAHCRATGQSATFTKDNVRYSGRCQTHPQYNNQTLNNDYALCKFSPEISLPSYGDLSSKTLKAGDKIVMQGYGAGSANGILNLGEGMIARAESWRYVTLGALQLGSGDSGGSLLGSMTNFKDGPFYVVGVNSHKSGSASGFNRTDIPVAQNWFLSWATNNKAELCGVNKDCLKKEIPKVCESELFIFNTLTTDLAESKVELDKCIAAN